MEAQENKAEAVAPSKDPQKIYGYWMAAIKQSGQMHEDFEKRGNRITKRYRQMKENDNPVYAGSKFNLFWSNVQTLAPATYARLPKVEVYRRFADSDPIARLGGLILERAIQYELDCNLSFHQTMKSVVLDRLLPGRGTVWVRYEPSFNKEEVPRPPREGEDPMTPVIEEVEVIADEKTPVDYVYWKDFRCGAGRVWEDVPWVGRRVLFSRDRLKARFEDSYKRFGGNIMEVPQAYDPSTANKEITENQTAPAESDPSLKKSVVWEIWDKESKQVIWVCEGCIYPLDIRDDPAKLKNFFPCPKPLFATMTNDQIIPVADYIIYRDQLNELDEITTRISLLVKGLRVIGVYDSSQPALKNLLASGMENRMVPVDAWGAFAEKGGLKGVTDFLPLDAVVAVLSGLYDARERIKQTVYEITGMADIVRGASMASETLGAQQIKAKFANLRLSSRQMEVAEFVTNTLQIKAELMCDNYTPDTLARISAAEQIEEIKKNPQLLQEAIAFLKQESVRQYRVTVMSDSMIELDEVDEQKRRNEFMSTLANFFLAMKNVAAVAPEMMSVSLEMLRFVIRGFPVGRTLEYAVEDAIAKITERMAQPPTPQPPSPDEVKLQIAQLKEQNENLRVQFREDAATDREEMKTALALELQNMSDRLDRFLQTQAALDSANQQTPPQGASQ